MSLINYGSEGGGTSTSYFKGYFDPTVANGGTGVAFPVINGTTDFLSGEYVLANKEGTYNFDTGLPDALGTPVQAGARVAYDGTVWTAISSEEPLFKGWMNASVNGGGFTSPIVNSTVNYGFNEYVIVSKEGQYDLATGLTTTAPAGTFLRKGDRLRFDDVATSFWDVLSDQAVATSFSGFFNPNVDGGDVENDVVNGSTEFLTDDYLTVETFGFYDLATGLTSAVPTVSTTRFEKGDTVKYNGTVFEVIRESIDKMRTWFDPTINSGSTDGFRIQDGELFFIEGEYVIANANGQYNFATGLPDAINGIPVLIGEMYYFLETTRTWKLLSSPVVSLTEYNFDSDVLGTIPPSVPTGVESGPHFFSIDISHVGKPCKVYSDGVKIRTNKVDTSLAGYVLLESPQSDNSWIEISI